MTTNAPFVAILMGSESDLETLKTTFKTLDALDVRYEKNILSAHRTPALTASYVEDADARGCAVFIAAAGLAAHLAGAVAAHTIKPVIGIPLSAGTLNGMDSLLSTVQMPGGIPVATVAIGSAGAKNAAILAAQILALHDEQLTQKLIAQREDKVQTLTQQNEALKA